MPTKFKNMGEKLNASASNSKQRLREAISTFSAGQMKKSVPIMQKTMRRNTNVRELTNPKNGAGSTKRTKYTK